MTDWLNVGKIVNTHGVRGEVRVISRTDFPEERYAIGNTLYVTSDTDVRTPVEITSWRKHKQFDLLTFKGLDNLNEVEKFKGSLLQIHQNDASDELSEGEFYYHEIIGSTVYLQSGEVLGHVKEILSPGANDVWVVQSNTKGKKDMLIPYIDDVVKQVDVKSKKVVIHPMEGLLD
ncbi:ribosome maturation factor RimM [Evansella cellulosilytica]|uniref:Ribosome maturation factor RimM n=1 Tax=Evansella cellulosilytica (strain ATCC 21833 / DSM 2522 / FERM P-1141 / JCM 9156 / N-4) TaxID=649639 RepID=E6TSY9_EVAC2|nr:ribosome maturation factor RimM [Evansella cellulosilytica]ADU30781.1 16S rRNA processing protein RimM [Evansella cellulosilytica DSM 2522]